MDIFPQRRHPYYIAAPHYSSQSAGVSVLHLLCHHLNACGQLAYMVSVTADPAVATSPHLVTPVLTRQLAVRHLEAGLHPIAVYPETVSGNPMGCTTVIRYVLNFPSLLGGDPHFAARETVYGYSEELALAAGGSTARLLFMPIADTLSFYLPSTPTERRGNCFYARKHRLLGGKPHPCTQDAVEIRHGPGAQSKDEIGDLFRRSECFYAHENTALIYEAMLCGCPVVCIPGSHFNPAQCIASDRFTKGKLVWLDEPDSLSRAQANSLAFASVYAGWCADFFRQLQAFIADTQAIAQATPAPKTLHIRDRRISYAKWLAFAKMPLHKQWREIQALTRTGRRH